MRKAKRILVAILLLPFVYASQAQDPQPLSGQELSDFLGPVSPDAIRWTKYNLIFQLYNGEAMPPLSGHVGFYLGSAPNFEREPGTLVKGRLGIFPVKWYRSLGKDGLISQHALIRLGALWYVDIRVSANRQSDVDQIIAIISQLPLFNKKPEPLSGWMVVDEYPLLRIPILFIGPTLFGVGLWICKRRLRRRHPLLSRRLFLLAIYSGLVALIFTGSVFLELPWRLLMPGAIAQSVALGCVGASVIAAASLVALGISGLIVRWRGG